MEAQFGVWWAEGRPVLHPVSGHFRLDLHESLFFKKTGRF